MPAPPLDTTDAARLVASAQSVINGSISQLAARGGVDMNQSLAYDLAHAASAVATAQACLAYAERGPDESALVAAFLAIALRDLATRIVGREAAWGVESDWFAPFATFVAIYGD